MILFVTSWCMAGPGGNEKPLYFLPLSYDGYRRGYVFREGPHGSGYYKDMDAPNHCRESSPKITPGPDVDETRFSFGAKAFATPGASSEGKPPSRKFSAYTKRNGSVLGDYI